MAYFHTNVLDNQIKTLPTVGTSSGSIATFTTDIIDNLIACECDINALQSGSGTPSPSNPRAISGYSTCTISVADSENVVQDTYIVSFGQTVYGGVLDVNMGELTITHGYYTITGLENWSITGDGKIVYADVLQNCKLIAGQLGQSTAICNLFNNNPNAVEVRQATYDNQININSQYIGGYSTVKGRIVINCSDFTSVSDAQTFFQNNQTNIVYELATPIIVQLTPKQIETLIGVNNVFHDCNGQTEVKYLLTIGQAISE